MKKVERIIITLKLPKDDNNVWDGDVSFDIIKELILKNATDDWDARDISVQANASLISLLEYMGLDESNVKCFSQSATELNLNDSFVSNQLFNGATLFILSKE